MSEQSKSPAPAAPSGTILLLRGGRGELEVFMVVRHHQIDFASGALVFPGGKADPQDFDDALLPFLTGADDDPNMRAIQVSAIREAFEEWADKTGNRGAIDIRANKKAIRELLDEGVNVPGVKYSERVTIGVRRS